MGTLQAINPSRDEDADDMALIEAEMPELAAALREHAKRSASLLSRMKEVVAEGDRKLAELGLTRA